MSETDRHLDLAGYLAGSISGAERDEFEQHLSDCDQCRAAMVHLQPLTQALLESEPLEEPPTDLNERVLATIVKGGGESGGTPEPDGTLEPAGGRSAHRPRGDHYQHGSSPGVRRGGGRSRLRIAGLVAALALAIAGVALALSGGGGADYEATLASDDLGGSIRLTVRDDGGNRTIELEGDSIAPAGPDSFYELWLVPSNDRGTSAERISVGTFRPAEGGELDAILSTPVDPSEFPRVELTREQIDGNPQTSPPVIASAELAS